MEKKVQHLERTFESQLREHEATIEQLERQLEDEHSARQDAEAAWAQEAQQLQCQAQEKQHAAIIMLENQVTDLSRVVQVKNVMLDDQARQLMEVSREKEEHRQERQMWQREKEDLEHALDESLAREQAWLDRHAEVEGKARDIENDVARLKDMACLRDQVAQKTSALEFLEAELHQMRKRISKQDEKVHATLEKVDAEVGGGT
jgi:chromosome segregation ATPase